MCARRRLRAERCSRGGGGQPVAHRAPGGRLVAADRDPRPRGEPRRPKVEATARGDL